jgi:hypothetical protein
MHARKHVTPLKLCHLAAAAFMALMSAPAFAAEACAEWSLRGDTFLIQSNNPRQPTVLGLEQEGEQLKGIAAYGGSVSLLSPGEFEKSGPVTGKVTGNSFSATVYWGNGSIGVYTGTIDAQGVLSGQTFDKANPRSTAVFHARIPLKCHSRIPSAPGAQAAAPGPTKVLGRVERSAATPSSQPSICEAARSARARNSPTAPALERRCSASVGPTETPRTQATGTPPPAEVVPAARAAASPLKAPALAPLATQRNKADAVALNPQPLPPASPLVLPAQVPSALR